MVAHVRAPTGALRFESVHPNTQGRSMRTEIVLSHEAPELDLDLDLRVSDLPEQAASFGEGTFTSPSSYAIGTRCPICC
ncbi:lantipeptide (TIGR04451 family) [Streptomyces sp. 2221.1]|nr:lantipeptide (TIGR04451 family) [Streptomyces sp. 2221.1]